VRGAIRQRRTGPAGLLMEGFAAAALITLLPWTSLAAFAAAPLAFIAAREAERRHKTTQWVELRHSSLGDPLSWSGV
jgi:hypothetical protein